MICLNLVTDPQGNSDSAIWMEIHFHSIWFWSKLLSVSWWNRRGLKFGCCSSISPLISILSQAAADPVLPGHKLREREMVSRDSCTKVLPLLWPTILTPSLTRIYHQSSYTKNCCINTLYYCIELYSMNMCKIMKSSRPPFGPTILKSPKLGCYITNYRVKDRSTSKCGKKGLPHVSC